MRLRRVLWIVAGIVTIVAAAVVTLAIVNHDPDADHQAPGATGPCETPVSAVGMATYHIIAPTAASYTVHENIPGNAHNVVVGKTNSVQGTFLVQTNGIPQVASVRLTIDLTTLKTDSSERDDQVSFIYLNTDDYPKATFTSTCTRGLPTSYRNGQTIAFHLVGNLTMHGKTNAEDFTMKAKLTGTTVTGSATATIYMTDFGISPPNFVDFDVVANKTTVKLDFTAQAES